jgi:hypothetical protein
VTPTQARTTKRSVASGASTESPKRRVRKSGEPGPPPDFDPRLMSRLARNVEILSVDLSGAHFDRADDDAISTSVVDEVAPQVGISVEWKIDDEEHLLGCVMTFGTNFERKPEPYNIIARFRLLYAVNPEVRPSREEINQFAHWNAMFNAWPYWREYAASTINRAHLPQFVMPVMAVPIPSAEGA